MRRLAFAVLLTLASVLPASAQHYRALPLFDVACSSGQVLIEMVDAGLESKAIWQRLCGAL